jgi:hypothetical protein
MCSDSDCENVDELNLADAGRYGSMRGLSEIMRCWLSSTLRIRGHSMFGLMLAIALVSAPHAQRLTFHVQGESIQVTPENGFQPTPATFVSSERSCPSVSNVVSIRSCLSRLMSAPFSTGAILANCERDAAKLGCRKSPENQLVSVQTIYDLTVSGQKTDECMIAKVRFGGDDDRYVDMAALLFRSDLKLPGLCRTRPSVRVRTMRMPDDRLLPRTFIAGRRTKAMS